MTFKRAIWYPVSMILSGLNLVAVGFATGEAEPWHAGAHAVLALAFGLWAQRLNRPPAGGEFPVPLEAFEALEAEVSRLRDDLSETQERLDFTERLVVQGQESRRVGPER
ncbi:MAG TPA: hypothetical protein VFH26_06165 [Gemmatimonadales bacterium]|nr:hypothetical protein [Gemmatimonadales bacterium]